MFVKTLNIILADWIKVPAEGLSPLLERKIHERLVFTNPDYEQRHNRGEWIGNIPPQISCMKQKGRNYLLPRGFLDQFLDLCKKFQQPYRVVDKRRTVEPVDVEFHGELKSYQQDAAEAVLEKDFATLIGGHKSGKTVIALYTIAQRRQPALILIPKLDLLDGWLTKIENFLQIPSSEVGIFTSGAHQMGDAITIAHTGEMVRFWRKIYERVGYVIVDEVQRCPSKVLTNLLPNFDTRYMLGLSNASQRKDRLSRLVYYYAGDVVYTIDDKDAREGRGIIHAQVIARQTEFEYPYQSRADYASMLENLMRDGERTRIIADDIESELRDADEPLLVLSGGEEQSSALAGELERRGLDVLNLGHESSGESMRFLGEADPEGSARGPCSEVQMPERPAAVLVTPKTLVQCAANLRSRTLFLAVPVYFRKHMADAIRNLHMNGSEENRLRIYDYVDRKVGLLDNYFRMRSYNYGVHPDLLLNNQLN